MISTTNFKAYLFQAYAYREKWGDLLICVAFLINKENTILISLGLLRNIIFVDPIFI